MINSQYIEELYLFNPKYCNFYVNRDNVLGNLLKQIFEGINIPDNLAHLSELLNMKVEMLNTMYQQYLHILNEREVNIKRNIKNVLNKDNNVKILDFYNQNHWGSIKQFKAGKIVIDTLEYDLHPVFGVLLNPSGGLLDNNIPCYIHKKFVKAYELHIILHDSFGYCKKFHIKGPGFNYLNTWFTLFSTDSKHSCEIKGLYETYKIMSKWNTTTYKLL